MKVYVVTTILAKYDRVINFEVFRTREEALKVVKSRLSSQLRNDCFAFQITEKVLLGEEPHRLIMVTEQEYKEKIKA